MSYIHQLHLNQKSEERQISELLFGEATGKKLKTAKKPRKTVSITVQKRLFIRSKGKCEKCRKTFTTTPDFHHKNGNSNNNTFSNIVVVCPNCHRAIHQKSKITKKRIKKLKKSGS